MPVEADADRVRAELVEQLRESLARSRMMMLNDKLEPRAREVWTQKHVNICQTLNMILRDAQLRDWEERLQLLEDRRRRLAGLMKHLEATQTKTKQETTEQVETSPDPSREEGS